LGIKENKEYPMVDQQSETDLVQKAKSGDQAAFEELLVRARPKVYGAINRILQGNSVDDVWQKTCLKAWRSIAKFGQRSRFSTWMSSIAINESFDQLERVESGRTESWDASQPDEDVGEDSSELREIQAFRGGSPNALSRRYANLNEEHYLTTLCGIREELYSTMTGQEIGVVEARYLDGIAAEAVAGMFGFSDVESVYEITRKFRQRLRHLLELAGLRMKGRSSVVKSS
jgi:RNA polymerase sigma factor (sigma-70 family)